ncbi:MAG: CCA tRNA nucleotidyltransferase [Bdellovibrio sp.]|nr:MAG: CCA tRNA nucleotidyltransferase [Bdellovibrio sp.]
MVHIKPQQIPQLLGKHPHWAKIQPILKKLSSNGFSVWLVGGSVRDLLLGKMPKDFDLVTAASVKDMFELFPEALEVGKSFGIAILPLEGFQVEIATLRKEGAYQDGRHPQKIEHTNDPREDALRRDFTVNALFWDPFKMELLDFVGGLRDLQKKVLKTVGDPLVRFQEDHLRVLRAIRFAAQLDFEIEPQTRKAIEQTAPLILKISKERVFQELNKILHFKSRGIYELMSCSLFQVLFPFLKGTEAYWPFLKKAFHKALERESFLWALFLLPHVLQDFEERFSMSKKSLKELRCSNAFLREWSFFVKGVKELEEFLQAERYVKAVQLLDEPLGKELLYLARLKRSIDGLEQKDLDSLERYYLSLLDKQTGHLPKPLINGHDLKKMGTVIGPRMSFLLEQIYEYQLQNQIKDKDTLLDNLEEIVKEEF